MFDIIIVGAGTAGMTAGLYALRAGRSVLVLENKTFGGQIAFSPRVENYPSVKLISGEKFAENLLQQIIDNGAQIELEEVKEIQKKQDKFSVITDFNTYDAKSVIIASGVNHKHIGVIGEQDLIGKGVSYCAVCDGAFYSGEDVAVVGSGNTALQYAILLSNYCKKVYICTRRNVFTGDLSLQNILKARENVQIIHNVGLDKFLQLDGELSGLQLNNFLQNKESINIDVKACFVAIGQIPNNKIFGNIVAIDDYGYIIAGEDCKTSCEGIFVAGDCRTKSVRQLITASADGAIASMGACEYIDRL